MKKSLKLVGIFMIVMIVGVVGGLSIYFLIANNKTYYIYDLRIVEPVAGKPYFVYTDASENPEDEEGEVESETPEMDYVNMKNKVLYMTSPEENVFEIAIYASTSTNTTQVQVKSTNTSVANVYSSKGHLFVRYVGAGEADIVASIGEVSDKIKLTVYDIPAEEFVVLDDKYYGENYSKYFPNNLVIYADNNEYNYRYETSGTKEGEYTSQTDNQLLAIDYSNIDKNIFPDPQQNIKLDMQNKQLTLTCVPTNVSENVNTVVPIQSYYYTEDGEKRVVRNYFVKVRVITYTPQFLQIVLSKTPSFDDGAVFMDTIQRDITQVSDDEITEDPTILDDFLNYQMAESGLSTSERSTYHAYFSQKVSKIYMQIRKVYTNGDIVYLNPLTKTDNPFELTTTQSDLLQVSADKTYYVLNLGSDYFQNNETFTLGVKLSNYALSHDFVFEYTHQNTETDIEHFYKLNDDGTYTYTYWDPRMHFANEAYDENGQIFGFGK